MVRATIRLAAPTMGLFAALVWVLDPAWAADWWDVATVDTAPDHSSLAVSPDGELVMMSYCDPDSDFLKLAEFDGETWVVTTVVEDTCGWFSSLAFLPSGDPVICYAGSPDNALKFAWWDGGWQTTVVDSEGAAGAFCSLAIFPWGQGISHGHLKFSWHLGEDFQTPWQTHTVHPMETSDTFTSLAVLPSGQPAISYRCDSAVLNFAWHEGFDPETGWYWTTVDLDYQGGAYSSLAILPSGEPAIGYQGSYGSNLFLKYAWHDGPEFEIEWNTTIVDHGDGAVPWAGLEPSLAIQTVGSWEGQPAIAYIDRSYSPIPPIPRPKYAWFDGRVWHTMGVGQQDVYGWYTGLAFLPSGKPVITYSTAFEHPNALLCAIQIATPGDLDDDRDVDLDDFSIFAECLAGPDLTDPPPGCAPSEFEYADLDGDDDADLADFSRFQAMFSGP